MHHERNTANYAGESGIAESRPQNGFETSAMVSKQQQQPQSTLDYESSPRETNKVNDHEGENDQTQGIKGIPDSGSFKRRPINHLIGSPSKRINTTDSKTIFPQLELQSHSVRNSATKLPWLGSQRDETGAKTPIRLMPERTWLGVTETHSKRLDNTFHLSTMRGSQKNGGKDYADFDIAKEPRLLNTSTHSHNGNTSESQPTSKSSHPNDARGFLFSLPQGRAHAASPQVSFQDAAEDPTDPKRLLAGSNMSGYHSQRYKHQPKRFLASLSQGSSRKNSLEARDWLKVQPEIITNAPLPSLSAHKTMRQVGSQEHVSSSATNERENRYPGQLQSFSGAPVSRNLGMNVGNVSAQTEKSLKEAQNTIDMARKWLKYEMSASGQTLADLVESNQRGDRILQTMVSARRGILLSRGLVKSEIKALLGKSELPDSYSLETLSLLRSKFDRDIVDSQAQMHRLTSELSSLDQRLDPDTTQDRHLQLVNDQVTQTQAKIQFTEKKILDLRSKLADLEAQNKNKRKFTCSYSTSKGSSSAG